MSQTALLQITCASFRGDNRLCVLNATRRRVDVAFDAALRELTERVAREAHTLIVAGETPPPTFGKWCASCSLVEVCQPESMDGKSARSWLARQIDQSLKVEDSLP